MMVAIQARPCLCDGWLTNVQHPNPDCPYYGHARLADQKAREHAQEQREIHRERRREATERFRRRGRG